MQEQKENEMEEVPRLLGYSVAFYTHDWMRNLCGVIYENKNRKQYFCLHCETERAEGERDSESVSSCLSIEWPKAVRGTETIILTHTRTHTQSYTRTRGYSYLCHAVCPVCCNVIVAVAVARVAGGAHYATR